MRSPSGGRTLDATYPERIKHGIGVVPHVHIDPGRPPDVARLEEQLGMVSVVSENM